MVKHALTLVLGDQQTNTMLHDIHAIPKNTKRTERSVNLKIIPLMEFISRCCELLL